MKPRIVMTSPGPREPTPHEESIRGPRALYTLLDLLCQFSITKVTGYVRDVPQLATVLIRKDSAQARHDSLLDLVGHSPVHLPRVARLVRWHWVVRHVVEHGLPHSMTKGAPEVVHDIVNLGNHVCGPRVMRRRKTGRLPAPTLRPTLLLQVAAQIGRTP